MVEVGKLEGGHEAGVQVGAMNADRYLQGDIMSSVQRCYAGFARSVR